MTEWQDISTAPRDGTRVLLLDDDGETILSGLWGRRFFAKNDSDWQWVMFEGDSETLCNPTHWMPLPQPPKGE